MDIYFEVTSISHTASSQISTATYKKSSGWSRKDGGEFIDVYFSVPEDEDSIKVANDAGRYAAITQNGNGFTLRINDPELFDRFKIGDKVSLASLPR